MIERALMTPDELKSMPKGQFIVLKTGHNPMKVRLKLFFDWGIDFEMPFSLGSREVKEVKYLKKNNLNPLSTRTTASVTKNYKNSLRKATTNILRRGQPKKPNRGTVPAAVKCLLLFRHRRHCLCQERTT